jgi:hypothetical protein
MPSPAALSAHKGSATGPSLANSLVYRRRSAIVWVTGNV